MDFDFYGDAVQEYLTEYSENIRRVLKKIKIPQAEIELQIQEEKEKIEKLVETNKEYAKLLTSEANMKMKKMKKNSSIKNIRNG